MTNRKTAAEYDAIIRYSRIHPDPECTTCGSEISGPYAVGEYIDGEIHRCNVCQYHSSGEVPGQVLAMSPKEYENWARVIREDVDSAATTLREVSRYKDRLEYLSQLYQITEFMRDVNAAYYRRRATEKAADQ